ncbi:hypothetical protein ACMXZU_04645 [Corynebacterium striatum]
MAGVGVGALPIAVSLKGLKDQIDSKMRKPLEQASKQAGESMRKNLANAAKQAADEVEKARKKEADAAQYVTEAEEKVQRAREVSEEKARAVESAELKLKKTRASHDAAVESAERELQQLRDSGKATTEELAAAEERLEQARDSRTSAVIDKENALSRTRRNADDATKALADEEKKLETARLNAADATDNYIAAQVRLDEANRKAKDSTSGLAGAFNKVKDAGSKIGNFAQQHQVQAGVAVGALVGLGKATTDYAAEAEQSYGAVESIFKQQGDLINNYSKQAADAVGMSGNEYREQAAYMGAMLKNQGVPMQELASKTQDLVALGADLASMYGGTTSEAVEALGATLRGETDPIERYGVSIKEADIKAQMAAMGLEELDGEQGKLNKSTALLALLTEQTADAQGNFARETDTAAHKQQVANAKLADAKEAIGTGLLPIYADLMDVMGKVAKVAGEHPKVFIAIAGAIGGIAAGIVIIAQVATVFGMLSGAAAAAGTTIGGLVAGFAAAAAPILAVVAAVVAVGVALWAFFTKTETGRQMWEKFTEALGKAWDWVVEKFKAGVEWIKTAFQGLKDLIVNGDFTGALRDAFGWEEDSPIVGKLLDIRDKFIMVKDAASDFWQILSGNAKQGEIDGLAKMIGVDRAEEVLNTITDIRGAIDELFGAFQGKDNGYAGLANLFGEDNGLAIANAAESVGKALSGAKDKAIEFGKSAGDFIGKTFGKIKDILEPLLPVFAELGRSIGGAVFEAFKALWGAVKSLWKTFKALWDVLSPLLLPILKIIGAVVGGVLVGAFLLMLGALKLVAKAAELLLKAFTWLLDNAITPLIKFVGDLASGLIDGLGGAIGWVAEIAPKLWNGIKDGASGLWGVLTGVWNGIKDGAVGAWDGIIGAITGAWDAVTGVIGGAFSWIQSTIIEPLVSFVTGTLIPAVTNIFTTIGDKWEAFKGWLQTVGSDFLAVLKDAWNVIVAFFTGDKEDVYNALGELWESLKTLTTDVWNGIRDALVDIWDGLVETATTVWTAIKDAIVNVWNGLKDSVTSAWQATWDFIVNVWNGIPGFAASVWEAVKNAVINAWNEMMSFISGIGPAIRDFVANIWAAIKNTSQSTWQEIKNVVLNAWEALKTGISNAIQALRDKINSFVNNAREAFGRFVSNVQEVPGKIKSAFANAGSWLLDAGKNIIRGLANGVRNAAGMVEDAIRAVIPDSVERFVPGLHFGGLAGFARGGVLPAIPGVSNSQRDPILGWSSEKKQPIARVEPGEFIVNREATKEYLPLLAAINGGKLKGREGDLGLPGYAAGGVVSAQEMKDFFLGKSVKGYQASQPLQGAPYVFGGSNWGDCTGTTSAGSALAVGQNPFPRKYFTGSQTAWMNANGAIRGVGPKKNNWVVSHYNGGPGGGHSAASIFDENGRETKIEMGGGPSMGHFNTGAGGLDPMFTDVFHIPLKATVDGVSSSAEEALADGKIAGTSTEGVTVDTGLKLEQIDWGSASNLASEWSKNKNRREKLRRYNAGIFDTGGILKPNSFAFNASGKPERILDPALTKAFEKLAATSPRLANALEKYSGFVEQQVKSVKGGSIQAYLGTLDASSGLDLADRVGKLVGIDGIKSTFGGVADAWVDLEDAAIQQVDASDALKQAEKNLAKARKEGKAEDVAKAEEELAQARGVVQAAAAATGQAQIAMALQVAELVINIGKKIWDFAWSIVEFQKTVKAQSAAYFAEALGNIATLTKQIEDQRSKVTELLLDWAAGFIKLRQASWDARVAQADVTRAQLEGAKKVAEAEEALQAERNRLSRMQKGNLYDMGLLWDSYHDKLTAGMEAVTAEATARWNEQIAQNRYLTEVERKSLQGIIANRAKYYNFEKLSLDEQAKYAAAFRAAQEAGLGGLLERAVGVTPELMALQWQVYAAQKDQQIRVKAAAIEAAEAIYKQQQAAISLGRLSEDLARQTELAARLRGQQAANGMDYGTTLAFQQWAELAAKNAELEGKRDSGESTGTVIKGWLKGLVSFGLWGKEDRDVKKSYDAAIKANTEQMRQLQEQFLQGLSGEQFTEMKTALDAAARQFAAGNKAAAEALVSAAMSKIKGAITTNDLTLKISDWKAKQTELDRKIEDSRNELKHSNEILPLQWEKYALEREKAAAENSAEAIRANNPAVRDAAATLAKFEAAEATRSRTAAEKLIRVEIPEDGYVHVDVMAKAISDLSDEVDGLRTEVNRTSGRTLGARDILALRK